MSKPALFPRPSKHPCKKCGCTWTTHDYPGYRMRYCPTCKATMGGKRMCEPRRAKLRPCPGGCGGQVFAAANNQLCDDCRMRNNGYQVKHYERATTVDAMKRYALVYDPCEAKMATGMKFSVEEFRAMKKYNAFAPGTKVLDLLKNETMEL